jgi:hypothetical protein
MRTWISSPIAVAFRLYPPIQTQNISLFKHLSSSPPNPLPRLQTASIRWTSSTVWSTTMMSHTNKETLFSTFSLFSLRSSLSFKWMSQIFFYLCDQEGNPLKYNFNLRQNIFTITWETKTQIVLLHSRKDSTFFRVNFCISALTGCMLGWLSG